MAGANCWTCRVNGLAMPPGEWTTKGTSPVTVKGNCAVICVEETWNSGKAWLLTVTHESPSAEGSGGLPAEVDCGASPRPEIVTRPPGATPTPPSALLVTEETLGIGVGAS